MTDDRIWTDIEYKLADSPGFTRPTGDDHFKQVHNGMIIRNLFPNKKYDVRIRYGRGEEGSDWIYLPTMTTTSDGEILLTFEFR